MNESTASRVRQILLQSGVRAHVKEYAATSVDLTTPVGAVYLLIERGEVVYVGQTQCMASRYLSYRWEQLVKRPPSRFGRNRKTWDCIWYIELADRDRNPIEKLLTESLRPKQNGWHWVPNHRVPREAVQTL